MFLTKGGAVVSRVEANLQESYPCYGSQNPQAWGVTTVCPFGSLLKLIGSWSLRTAHFSSPAISRQS